MFNYYGGRWFAGASLRRSPMRVSLEMLKSVSPRTSYPTGNLLDEQRTANSVERETDLPIEAEASIRRGVDRPRCQPSCPMQLAPAAAVNVMHTSVGNIFRCRTAAARTVLGLVRRQLSLTRGGASRLARTFRRTPPPYSWQC